MFKLTFLGALADKPEVTTKNAEQVIAFCKSIDWLQELKDFNKGYNSSGDEVLSYNDDWHLNIINEENQSGLNIYTDYADHNRVTIDNLEFVMTYSWETFEKNGWLDRLFSGKEEKKVVTSTHVQGVNYKTLPGTIKSFVNGDVSSLKAVVNEQGLLSDRD